MNKNIQRGCEYSEALIALHKNEICREDRELWDILMAYQNPIREYYNKLFLDIHLDEEEGYAFLKSLNTSKVGDDESHYPRLLRRVELTKAATLLLVLLREALYQFDISHQESLSLIISRNEIREMMLSYTDHQSDDTKFITWSNQAIDSVVALGCLKSLRESESNQEQQKFEVRRIIKARISAEELNKIKIHFPIESNISLIEESVMDKESL